MPFKIAIASGKGGTGKTTVAVHLYWYLANKYSPNIKLVDCDVEEPNDIIFFPEAEINEEKAVFQDIPEIVLSQCSFCKKCAEYCEFNAIVVLPPAHFAEVNNSLCHSCGACLEACNDNAIIEKKEPVGSINYYRINRGNGIKEGILKIGSVMQTMMIRELKKSVSNKNEIIIFDAPPGTSCPVVETVADADYVILVTEPTPFGLYDLQLSVDLLNDMKKPFGVIINKAGLGDDQVYNYLRDEGITLLGEIPFSREYAVKYAKGELLDDIPDIIDEHLRIIAGELENRLIQYEGNNYFKW